MQKPALLDAILRSDCSSLILKADYLELQQGCTFAVTAYLGKNGLKNCPQTLDRCFLPKLLDHAMPIKIEHSQLTTWQSFSHPPDALGKMLAQQQLISSLQNWLLWHFLPLRVMSAFNMLCLPKDPCSGKQNIWLPFILKVLDRLASRICKSSNTFCWSYYWVFDPCSYLKCIIRKHRAKDT